MTICHPKVGPVQPVIKIIMTRIIKPDNSHSQCFCFNRDRLVHPIFVFESFSHAKVHKQTSGD